MIMLSVCSYSVYFGCWWILFYFFSFQTNDGRRGLKDLPRAAVWKLMGKVFEDASCLELRH